MPVRNLRGIRPWIWVPPSTAAAYKITVERGDGTVDDITEDIVNLVIEDYVTESIGKFSFEIHNANNEYTDAWIGNEVVKYYKDYAASATTLRFRGRLEKISKTGHYIKADGRSESLVFLSKTVTGSYSNVECSVILKDIIDNFAPSFTYSNVNVSETSITVNWYEKPFWDCVKELCAASSFDCYVDANLDFNFFQNGSILNNQEAIVHGMNLDSIDDFTPDVAQVRNRIIIYGANQEGIQLIHTTNDSTSQTLYGIREEVITDDNITSETQAEEYATWVLAQKKDPPVIGGLTSALLLATIKPGDAIKCSSPDDGITTGDYYSSGYKDTIGQDKITTEVFLAKEPRKISRVMADRVTNENKTSGSNINPEAMRYTYNFLFEDGTGGSYTNTTVASGLLYATVGGGYWISPPKDLTTNSTEAYVVLNGTETDSMTFEISGDGGSTYQTLNVGSKTILSTGAGVSITLKITFATTTARLDSFSLQYNVS